MLARYCMLWTVLAAALIAVLPWALTRLAEKAALLGRLGPVFLCYAAGLLGSFFFRAVRADMSAVTTLYSLFVMLAIPLILFSADLGAVRRLARPMLLSFALGTAAVLVTASAGFVLFARAFPSPRTSADVAAMLIGMYTGGTPNTLAIGKALGAGDSILLVQTADIVCGGAYFLLLISVLPGLFGKVLRPYRGGGRMEAEAGALTQELGSARKDGRTAGVVKSVALAAGCVLVSAALALALPVEEGAGRFSNIDRYTAVIMLVVTTLGVALSFVKKVRALPGSYDAGQYLILMFSVGMGLCFDLESLGAMLTVLVMVLFIELVTVALHLLLAKLCGIDRDTMMITSVAGVFGPAFIIPAARALKNDEIVLPGILCGILGYAIGNYLGIGLGTLFLRLAG